MQCLFGSAVKIRKSAAYEIGIWIREFCGHPARGKVFFMNSYWNEQMTMEFLNGIQKLKYEVHIQYINIYSTTKNINVVYIKNISFRVVYKLRQKVFDLLNDPVVVKVESSQLSQKINVGALYVLAKWVRIKLLRQCTASFTNNRGSSPYANFITAIFQNFPDVQLRNVIFWAKIFHYCNFYDIAKYRKSHSNKIFWSKKCIS